ncbi:MAG: hypothetical protein KKH72_05350 [Alphaproteobacteria bacterium]|nr:hypothetical protein [Alphaproteobacteria bacterium]
MQSRTIKSIVAAALAAAVVGMPAARAQLDYWIAGIWDTSEGQMSIEHHDPDVSGTYSQDRGRIFGTLDGHQLTGFWVEQSSGVKCDAPRDGSYHWGRIVFDFDAEFDAFSGTWGYCDQNPSRSWTGALQAAAKLLR